MREELLELKLNLTELVNNPEFMNLIGFYNGMINSPINLYVDCDGTIIDTMTVGFEMCRQRGIINDEELRNRFFQREADFYEFFRRGKVLADAIDNINLLNSTGLFDISILTASSPYSLTERPCKVDYFTSKLPSNKLIFSDVSKKEKKCETKGVKAVHGILIDDSVKHVNEWNKAGGLGLLFRKDDKNEFNTICDPNESYDGVIEVSSILDVVSILTNEDVLNYLSGNTTYDDLKNKLFGVQKRKVM